VVWRFSPAVAADARSYQFHPSQTSEEQAEGAVVVRFTAGGAEEQDFKLRVGDKPKRAATLEAAGEILLLDEDDGRVGLKIGPKAPPFEEAFSIIPSGPIDTSTLRDAVYRFADSVIAGDGRYSAITSILKREHPRIAGRQPGAAIVSENLESVGEAAIAISRLDHSHMLVQGPPGAGWRARNFRPVAIWVAKTATDPATARTSIVTATGRSAFSASSQAPARRAGSST
jgi:hypothetical protein